MSRALGLMEVLGLTTAMTALDAAIKAADVTFRGCDKVIGTGKAISLTLRIEGEVAAVQAAMDAGAAAGRRVGTVFSAHVIARPDPKMKALWKRMKG
ncbi:MAG: BMC domain-containing protein [Synergistaceae bacterium]|nr:BMC domain-containing protein [Synergistaceae bacterium]